MAINNLHGSWLSSCTRSMDQIADRAEGTLQPRRISL